MSLKTHGCLKLIWAMQDRLSGIFSCLCLGSQRPEGGVVLGLDYHVSEIHMLFSGFSHVVVFCMLVILLLLMILCCIRI